MSWEAWTAFAAASALLIAVPGPTVPLVCAYALGSGRGVALGDLAAMCASLLGLGALMAASGRSSPR